MPTLALVRNDHVADPVEQFGNWLLRRGISEASAHAYTLDVTRERLTVRSTVADHESTARSIAASPLAAATRSRRLAACAHYFDYTHPDAADNPYRVVRRPRTGVLTPAVVTSPDQGRALVEWFRERGTVSDLMNAAAAALMAGAGLRVGEVCSLTWDRIDSVAGTVRVTGKGDKTRDVPLGAYVLGVLQHYYEAVSATRQVQAFDHVVPVSVRTVQRAVSSAREALGVPGLHPHALRHGFGTAVQEAHGDLRLTADLLGHASISTTVIYTHVADDRRRAAVESAL